MANIPAWSAESMRGQTKIIMGFPETGARLIEAAIAHARHEENAHSLAWALAVAAHSLLTQHETQATVRFASEAIDTAREHRLPQWLALGERCKGWAIHQLGDFAAGLDLQQKGVRRWYNTGAVLTRRIARSFSQRAFCERARPSRRAPTWIAHERTARATAKNILQRKSTDWRPCCCNHEQAPVEIVEEYLRQFD